MTWASNVGELGVRDVLIEIEAELEGINTALNTPSALPGEVRMFVGKVPAGWEAFQDVLPRSSMLPSLQWLASSVGVPDVSPTSNSHHTRSLAMCDGQFVLQLGRPSATFSDNPLSAPIFVTDLMTQTTTQLQNFTITYPAMLESMSDGRVLFSGGVRASNSTPSNLCQVIDRFGVIEARAPMPGPRFRCASGKLSDDEVLVIGGALGTPGTPNPVSTSVYKYTYSTNTWATLPDFPVAISAGLGAVMTVAGKTVVVAGSSFFELDSNTMTFSSVPPPFPAGVTSINAHQVAYLKDGRAVMYCRYVESAVTYAPGFFIFDGVSVTKADNPPIGTSSNVSADNSCPVSTPIMTGSDRIIAIARFPGRADMTGGILADESQAFIMQRAIKYARKLP